jgi:hypothetical protein
MWLPSAVPSTPAIVKPSSASAAQAAATVIVPVATLAMCVFPPSPLPARTAAVDTKAIAFLLNISALCAYTFIYQFNLK